MDREQAFIDLRVPRPVEVPFDLGNKVENGFFSGVGGRRVVTSENLDVVEFQTLDVESVPSPIVMSVGSSNSEATIPFAAVVFTRPA